MTEVRGLHLYVWKSPLGDHTKGGFSSRVDQVLLVGTIQGLGEKIKPLPEDLMCPSWNIEGEATVALKAHNTARGVAYLVQVEFVDDAWRVVHSDNKHVVMAGGNVAGCQDSRFADIFRDVTGVNLTGAKLVNIHDRVE